MKGFNKKNRKGILEDTHHHFKNKKSKCKINLVMQSPILARIPCKFNPK